MSSRDDFFADFDDDMLDRNLPPNPKTTDNPELNREFLPKLSKIQCEIHITDAAIQKYADEVRFDISDKQKYKAAHDEIAQLFQDNLAISETLDNFVNVFAIDTATMPHLTLAVTVLDSGAYGTASLDIVDFTFGAEQQDTKSRIKFTGFTINAKHFIQFDVRNLFSSTELSKDILTHELGHTITQALPFYPLIQEGFAQYTSYAYRRINGLELAPSTINELPIINLNESSSGGLFIPPGLKAQYLYPLGTLLGEIGSKQLIKALETKDTDRDLDLTIQKFIAVVQETQEHAAKNANGAIQTHSLSEWRRIIDNIDPNLSRDFFDSTLMHEPINNREFTLWVPMGELNETKNGSWGTLYSFEFRCNKEFGLLPERFPRNIKPKHGDFCSDLGMIQAVSADLILLDENGSQFCKLQSTTPRMKINPDFVTKEIMGIADAANKTCLIDRLTRTFSIATFNNQGELVILSENMTIDKNLFHT